MILYLQTLPRDGQPPEAWADPRLCHLVAAHLYGPAQNLNKVIYRHSPTDETPSVPDVSRTGLHKLTYRHPPTDPTPTPLLAGSQPVPSEKDLLHVLWTELHQWSQTHPDDVLVAYQAKQRVLPTLLFRNFAHDLRLPFLDNPNLPHPVARYLDLAEVFHRPQAGRPLPLSAWLALLGFPPPPVPEGPTLQALWHSQHPDALGLILQSGQHYVRGLAALEEAWRTHRWPLLAPGFPTPNDQAPPATQN